MLNTLVARTSFHRIDMLLLLESILVHNSLPILCSFVDLGQYNFFFTFLYLTVFTSYLLHPPEISSNLRRCVYPIFNEIRAEIHPVSLLKVVPTKLLVRWILAKILKKLLTSYICDIFVEITLADTIALQRLARDNCVRKWVLTDLSRTIYEV